MKITRQRNRGIAVFAILLLLAAACLLSSCGQKTQAPEANAEETSEEKLEEIPKLPEEQEEEEQKETEFSSMDEITPDTEEIPPEDLTKEEPVTGGHVVVIDPGHQKKGDSTQEPNGPDSSVMKARVAGGTSGRTTGVPEYELTLDISLKLRDELEARGYTVYMTRETHDVNISNMERALYASSVGAEIAVRIHANGSEDTSVSGALALAPSSENPYVSYLASESQSLSKCILDAYCDATGMGNKGVVSSDTMTGINWSTVPVTILEMGFMTNPADDTNMQDAEYQQKMVQGIADGIDTYF